MTCSRNHRCIEKCQCIMHRMRVDNNLKGINEEGHPGILKKIRQADCKPCIPIKMNASFFAQAARKWPCQAFSQNLRIVKSVAFPAHTRSEFIAEQQDVFNKYAWNISYPDQNRTLLIMILISYSPSSKKNYGQNVNRTWLKIFSVFK